MVDETTLALNRHVARAPLALSPVTLQGRVVRLVPLAMNHHADLCAAGLDEEIWRWNPFPVQTPEDMRAYLLTALQEQAEGRSLPFAIVLGATGRAVGSTRFGNLEQAHRRVEIGWTWIGRPWQRTAVNTECKSLLLRHAFDDLHCLRVEFKTDLCNTQSRQAILRLGARQEGIFRNHIITSSGRVRHSVYFSIVDEDWPRVREHLQRRLEARITAAAIGTGHGQVVPPAQQGKAE